MPTLNWDTRTGLGQVYNGLCQLKAEYLHQEREYASSGDRDGLVIAQDNTDEMFKCILTQVEMLLRDEPECAPLSPFWSGNGYSENKPNCDTEK